MPNIENIPVPSYSELAPYHHIADNIPIDGLIDRIMLVNNQVDNNTSILAQSIGTQGSLANRLAQSINDDGSLKVEAVDDCLHSISEHLDGDGYVRMTLEERNKLSFISPDATSLYINISTISGVIPFYDTTLEIAGSDSITWQYDGSQITAETNFPSSVRHNHFYGLVPVTSDYENYETTSVATAYKEGTLRVYVNGVRLNSDHEVYVPFDQDTTTTWSLLSFTEGTATDGLVTAGDFVLSDAISSTDSIVIDFDILYS